MIRHICSIGEIVADLPKAIAHYRDVLGLAVEEMPGTGFALVKVPGVLHFGLWTREAAAEHTFGDRSKSGRIPLGFSVAFEVDSVRATVEDVSGKGCAFAQQPQQEPWGQVTARFFSPSGALCEVCETSWARELIQDVKAKGLEKAKGNA